MVVIGAGIAGLVVTLELLEELDAGKRILLLDRCQPHEVGGLAREAFGGMFMVDTPRAAALGDRGQRRARARGLAARRRVRRAGQWPRRWAEEYVARARDEVGGWLQGPRGPLLPGRQLGRAGRLRRRQLGSALPPHVGMREGARRPGLGRDPAPPAPLPARGAVRARASTELLTRRRRRHRLPDRLRANGGDLRGRRTTTVEADRS